MRDSRFRVALPALLAAVFVLGFIRIGVKLSPLDPTPLFADFGVYYQVGERTLHGAPVYNIRMDALPETATWWLYPPVFALLFIPFVIVPFDIAALLWTLVSASILVGAVLRLLSALGVPLSAPSKLAVGICALLFSPILSALFGGQVTPLIAAGLCLFGAAVFDDEPVRAGALATVSTVVKVTYLPAGAVLLRDGRRLAGAALAGVAVLGMSLLLFGTEQHLAFLAVISEGKGWGGAWYPAPKAWTVNTFAPWYLLYPFHLVANAIIVCCTLGVTLLTRSQDDGQTDAYVFALGLVAIPLAMPSPNLLALAVVVPAGVVLVAVEARRGDGHPIIPVVAAGLITIHPFVVEFIAGDIVRQVPVVGGLADALLPALPVLSPAVWGALLLFALPLMRLLLDRRGHAPREQTLENVVEAHADTDTD